MNQQTKKGMVVAGVVTLLTILSLGIGLWSNMFARRQTEAIEDVAKSLRKGCR